MVNFDILALSEHQNANQARQGGGDHRDHVDRRRGGGAGRGGRRQEEEGGGGQAQGGDLDQEVNNCLILNSFQVKEKEAFMEMIHVMIAFVIIMTMAVGTVALKLYMFPEEKIEGFQPLPQKVIFCLLIVILRSYLLR